MNGIDPCPTCGHDMEFHYGDRYHGSRKMSCWWCRQAQAETMRRNIGMKPDERLSVERVTLDLARQGMEHTIRELESEGAWL